MFTSNILIVFNTTDENTTLLYETLRPLCDDSIHEHSTIGIETVTLILTAGQLLVSIAALPIILDYIGSKKIILKVGGVSINDTPDKIINMLKDTPDIKRQVLEAYKNQSLQINGNVKQLLALKDKLSKIGFDVEEADDTNA